MAKFLSSLIVGRLLKLIGQAKEPAEEETLVSSRPTQTSHLLDLPFELLEYILSLVYIRNTGLKNGHLRLVCWKIKTVVDPAVFQSQVLGVEIKRGEIIRSKELLQLISSGHTPWTAYTKTLFLWTRNLDDSTVYHSDYSRSMALLVSAIDALQSVKVVRWTIKAYGLPQTETQLVTASIASLSNLDTLHLVADHTACPSLDDFKGLRYIELDSSLRDQSQFSGTVHAFARCIAKNGLTLRTLRVRTALPENQGQLPNLRDLFNDCSPEILLSLGSLRLERVAPWFDDTTIPHLLSLKSLTFEPNWENATYPMESSLERCCDTGIVLSEYDGPLVHAGSIRYLKSYSGLTKLFLRLTRQTGINANPMFQDIFTDVIPEHAGTLMDFEIHVEGRGLECSSSVMMAALAKCSNLRRFLIPVTWTWNPQRPYGVSEDGTVDIVADVMNAAFTLPRLSMIVLCPLLGPDRRFEEEFQLHQRLQEFWPPPAFSALSYVQITGNDRYSLSRNRMR